MGTKENMLLQDVCTRWNSTYAMLSRLQEQRWPVTATLSDPEVTQRGKHYLDLKPNQWSLIEELNQVLEPFHSATVFMSGEQYVTLSALPHVVDKIKKSLQSQNLESPPVVSFQTHAKEQVTTRWKDLGEFKPESPNITLLAASLDPRFRKLKFLPADQAFGVKNALQTMALAVKQQLRPTGCGNEASSTAEGAPSTAHKDKMTTSFLDSDSTSSDEEQDEEQLSNEAIQNEVLAYFGEQSLPKKDDPLIWWKANEQRFPTLAKLANSLLCIPATSTPSERLFSAAGNIVSKKRASLSPEHVYVLNFLRCNHRLFG
ncbi:E3 SUMO-protein ligase ZBED1-like [Nothobranchius furzeri]|uniref:E3 SUMO-protein ligase ZBED1-like n=1 Tax=Nothobranchius furzeri TaxID=105023 RepID=UPI003904AF80